MDDLTAFEHDALAAILDGDHPGFATLRAQLRGCSVSHREVTGVGFFTTLAVPPDVPTLQTRGRFDLGDVHVTMDGVAHGVGLVLFVEDGRLAVLEAFTYDDPWPAEVRNYTITRGGIAHFGGALSDEDQMGSQVTGDR